jgi:hypothetical protein
VKKFTLLVLLAILIVGTNAWAQYIVSLTFDGSQDLTYNPVNNQYGYYSGSSNIAVINGVPQNIVVAHQYNAFGVNFLSGSISAMGYPGVTNTLGSSVGSLAGATFGTPSYWLNQSGGQTDYVTSPINYTPTSNFIGFNKYTGTGAGYSGTAIKFSSLLSFLTFDLFRPGTTAGQSTPITIDLFNTSAGGGPVGSATVTAYNDKSWAHFDSTTITGSQFDLAVVYTSDDDRFMLDNLYASSNPPAPVPALGLFGTIVTAGGIAFLILFPNVIRKMAYRPDCK